MKKDEGKDYREGRKRRWNVVKMIKENERKMRRRDLGGGGGDLGKRWRGRGEKPLSFTENKGSNDKRSRGRRRAVVREEVENEQGDEDNEGRKKVRRMEGEEGVSEGAEQEVTCCGVSTCSL